MDVIFVSIFIYNKRKKPGKPEKRPFDENLTINVTDKYLMSTDLDDKIVLSWKIYLWVQLTPLGPNRIDSA